MKKSRDRPIVNYYFEGQSLEWKALLSYGPIIKLSLQKDRENIVVLTQALRDREDQIESLQEQLNQASR